MLIHLLTFMIAQSMMGGLPIDNIQCQSSEGAVEHIHAMLVLKNHGRNVGVPAYIGIPQGADCLYWLHTHTDDGLIHIESPVQRTFTLGQFFDIWNQPLSRTQAASVRASARRPLRVTVNGKPFRGNPRSIPLRDHEEIVISNS